jgi:hypothetical protein
MKPLIWNGIGMPKKVVSIALKNNASFLLDWVIAKTFGKA